MRGALIIVLGVCTLQGTGAAEDRIRPAIERTLPLLERASAGSADQRECFTCHNQGLPVLALSEARRHGFPIDEENFERQVEHTYAHLRRSKEKFLSGEGTGGKADTAGYALWTLSAAGRPSDEVTSAVTEFFLKWQATDAHWSCSSDRPPSESSDFTTTYVSLRGLVNFGNEEQQPAIAARRESAKAWLIDSSAVDNEDRVFRLWALQLAGADTPVVEAAATELIGRQREDGGWSQLDDSGSDAYATATALVVLQRTESLSQSDSVYQRGVEFLLNTQGEDGSWHVASRSDPFQAYYESGFPHGTDQFISASASAWATMALLEACPAVDSAPAE